MLHRNGHFTRTEQGSQHDTFIRQRGGNFYITIALSLGGLILLGLRVQNLSQHAQEKYFHIKYSSIIVDVQNADSIKLSSMVDVSTMDMLAKLAERFNAMILHVEQNYLHMYYVQWEAAIVTGRSLTI